MAPCSSCRNARVKKGEARPKCIVSPRSRKCSECVRKGYPDCDVTVSRPEWERLRDTRDALRQSIEKIKEEEVELLQKLAARRAKKIRLHLETAEAVEEQFLPLDESVDHRGFEVPEQPFPFFDVIEMLPSD
ncbi:hypothetical protein Q7P35_000808 [Cladosporium inversicolor]